MGELLNRYLVQGLLVIIKPSLRGQPVGDRVCAGYRLALGGGWAACSLGCLCHAGLLILLRINLPQLGMRYPIHTSGISRQKAILQNELMRKEWSDLFRG